MSNGMDLKIKEWFYEKTDATAHRYDIYIDFERNEEGTRKVENGYITVFVEEVIAETEKAIHVRLMSGSVVGSCEGCKTWIPKSVILN